MRLGLRQEDVNYLVRAVRAARGEGFGPGEAWARAKLGLRDVSPEVLEAWRPEVEKQVEAGTADSPNASGNLIDRNAKLDAEVSRLKRQLAEAGATNEKLRADAEKLARLGEENDVLAKEVARLTKENEELILGDPKKKK